MVVGTHSKKRPNNLVFIRLFDNAVLDMIEVGLENSKFMKDFESAKCALGMKPCFLFNVVDQINLAGLEHVITVTAGPPKAENQPGLIHFRVYTIQLKKSGTRLPRVELEEMGPSFDMNMRRTRFANPDVMKQALRVPKELKPKKVKNINHDDFGDKMGRIHMVKQDFNTLQTRKMKGLKSSISIPVEETEQDAAEDSTGSD
ncbi:rRNA-binding ribosome biosynthesis protein rpf2 [Entomophthora muscae]|uniref:rRNA-binding ribosome biosynthesis protein rpf2 n=1 Tax=Entomophthora muscae TaxID=34485 RepID=A0ACC2TW26_9FUNG|nr:rRNA-binding ribosome biosynthesis protein rpf2 [Entomophthora muscae]